MGTGMPEDVLRLMSEAYAHKTRVSYHRRRLQMSMDALRQRCNQLGIPVPAITANTTNTEPRRQSDPRRPDR